MQERNLVSMLGSSSSTTTVTPKHDVFLSFRGEDTRDNFTSYLYAELRRKNIETFIDYRLDKGEEISPALYKAIEESMIYVIIFSEDYASSTWCLAELTKILECKNRYGRDVVPVFYKVDPSTVRHQRGSYAEAFVKHQRRFKDDMDKLRTWKAALTEAAQLSGWDSQVTRPEPTLVADIVKDILRKLNHSFLNDYQGIIGIDKHMAKIESLLHLGSEAVRIIGIWGMGGIGKTTIANAVYHKLATQFNSSSLVLNVEEKIERKGAYYVQNKYLSELLGEDNRLHDQRLKRAKVLLVLDNVNNSGELPLRHDDFGQGSRIIITSRDMQVLKNANADEIYEVKEMNFQDSLRLFSLNAFKQNCPLETYMDLSVKVLNYAKGVPLAITVLGSLLYGRTKEAWRSELQKLEKLPDSEIFSVLKLSYDRLDEEQKDIFLDIACFYRGHLVNNVAETLDGCGFSADIGMDVLKDRCLISISEGRIMMHDLIQEMGEEIVRQECVRDPGKRSRLWKHEEIYHVLRKNKGKRTDAIQCIFLDICKIKKVKLHAKTFKNMDNLRMLHFYNSSVFNNDTSNVILPALLQSLPDDLKFLRWDGFSHRSLPLDFRPESLVTLDMPHSHLTHLWEGDQDLPNLKRLDLSYSRELIRIPDLSVSPNIKEIILSHCVSLVQVYSSSFLSKLNCLCLNGCVELRSLNLPSNILSGSSGLVLLYNCCKLETFSISSTTEVVQSHGRWRYDGFWGAIEIYDDAKFGPTQGVCRVFNEKICRVFDERFSLDPIANTDSDRYEKEELVDGTHLLKIEMVRETTPSSFPSLNGYCWLDLCNCESLTSLPIELCKLKFVKRLYLDGCSNLEIFPKVEAPMENLTVLTLDKTAIKELPSSLHHLVGLEELSLKMCQRLEIIPSSIGGLSKLCKLDLTYCESLETFPSTIFKLKLTKLDLHGCSMLKTFPEILEPAESFAYVNLTKTAIEELPSSLDYLVGLQTLRLNLCRELESLPNSIVNLSLLSELDCSGCVKLREIPKDIGRLSLLRELSLQESSIVNLPESIAHLSSLKSLDLSDCKRLECIPQLPPFLKQLSAFDCPSITSVMLYSDSDQARSLPSEDTFKFHFTNNEEQDASVHSNIVANAQLRITGDAYRFVFYCFPGSAVPHWLPFRSEGHSVTVNRDSLNWCWCDDNSRLIGFALCVVLGTDVIHDHRGYFRYRLTFQFDGRTHVLSNHDGPTYNFVWKDRMRSVVKDHIIVWKHHLDSASMENKLFHAHGITFEIITPRSIFKNTTRVKECGICPLFTKQNNDDTGIKRPRLR